MLPSSKSSLMGYFLQGNEPFPAIMSSRIDASIPWTMTIKRFREVEADDLPASSVFILVSRTAVYLSSSFLIKVRTTQNSFNNKPFIAFDARAPCPYPSTRLCVWRQVCQTKRKFYHTSRYFWRSSYHYGPNFPNRSELQWLIPKY